MGYKQDQGRDRSPKAARQDFLSKVKAKNLAIVASAAQVAQEPAARTRSKQSRSPGRFAQQGNNEPRGVKSPLQVVYEHKRQKQLAGTSRSPPQSRYLTVTTLDQPAAVPSNTNANYLKLAADGNVAGQSKKKMQYVQDVMREVKVEKAHDQLLVKKFGHGQVLQQQQQGASETQDTFLMKTEDRDKHMLQEAIKQAAADVAKKKPKIDRKDPLYKKYHQQDKELDEKLKKKHEGLERRQKEEKLAYEN